MVSIVCNSPLGYRLKVGSQEVVLTTGVNQVDDTFWDLWVNGHVATTATDVTYPPHRDYPPFVSGEISVHLPLGVTEAEAEGVAPTDPPS